MIAMVIIATTERKIEWTQIEVNSFFHTNWLSSSFRNTLAMTPLSGSTVLINSLSIKALQKHKKFLQLYSILREKPTNGGNGCAEFTWRRDDQSHRQSLRKSYGLDSNLQNVRTLMRLIEIHYNVKEGLSRCMSSFKEFLFSLPFILYQ